jgi:hypothetical protein
MARNTSKGRKAETGIIGLSINKKIEEAIDTDKVDPAEPKIRNAMRLHNVYFKENKQIQ